MKNPFCSHSMLNRPLLPELCQRIHAEALLRVARGRNVDEAPGSVPTARLRELMSLPRFRRVSRGWCDGEEL